MYTIMYTESEMGVASVYGALRERIVGFSFPPQSRLSDVALGQLLGTSRVPVREALNRLWAEGLIERSQKGGFRMRALSAREIRSLFLLRSDLEVGALMRRAPLGVTAIDELEDEAKWAIANAQSAPMAELIAIDERFHARLAIEPEDEARSALLAGIAAKVRFVRGVNLERPGRGVAAFSEHLAILSALKAGEVEAAAEGLRRHLELSAEAALDAVHAAVLRLHEAGQ